MKLYEQDAAIALILLAKEGQPATKQDLYVGGVRKEMMGISLKRLQAKGIVSCPSVGKYRLTQLGIASARQILTPALIRVGGNPTPMVHKLSCLYRDDCLTIAAKCGWDTFACHNCKYANEPEI